MSERIYHGVICTGESMLYYKSGELHREDGPAVEFDNGHKEWWLNGERHRVDGPAVEYVDSEKHWYLNGELHRANGPAVEGANGDKLWWLNGVQMTEAEHAEKVKGL